MSLAPGLLTNRTPLKPATGNPRVWSMVQVARRAHLIGIAGAGMSSLARVLLQWGWKLSGSDLALGLVREMSGDGVCLHEGHAAAHLPQSAELVIHSDAIPADNPELRRAAQLGIPTCSYFEALAALSAGRRGLAVAGTHGKSTTTAMAAEILIRAGHDPTVLCGAAPLGQSCGGRAGRGDLVLVEACEYRANFLHLRPETAVILAVEPDHFDYYDSLENLQRAFARFAHSVPAHGLVLVRHESAEAGRAVAGVRCRVETFGLDEQADWSARRVIARAGRCRFKIFRSGQCLAEVDLRVPGRHNVLNALAAAALAGRYGARPEEIADALGRFRGLRRRLELLGTWRGVDLLDDYAHHPTEVAAALEAVRGLYPGRRVWCVFQPHQVSRTRRLLDELADSLHNTDRVLVAEIFRAREPAPKPGEVTAADLAQKVRARGAEVPHVHTPEAIARLLETSLAPGDVLITMGAGDIRKIHAGLTGRMPEAGRTDLP